MLRSSSSTISPAKARAVALAARYRDSTRTTTSLSNRQTQYIRPRRFAGMGIANSGGAMMPTAGVDSDPYDSIWNEHILYGDDAQGKFQHLVDSLNRFHESFRDRAVSFTIV